VFRDLATGSSQTVRRCDLLILGAGPAGITLAVEASRMALGMDIVLAEAGGLDRPGADELRLYDGESTGDSVYPINGTRLRYFGGTSGHWGGWCKPLDAIDLEHRPEAGSPGWPLDPGELQPHYRAAAEWLELGSSDFSIDSLDAGTRDRLLNFAHSEWFTNRLFRISPPTRFGDRYRATIQDGEGIECILNAAAVAYVDRGRRLHEVTLSGLHGKHQKIQAGRVVIAMGGIESTRHLLLLQSAGCAWPGLINGHLGRGFADHFGPRTGLLSLPAGLRYERSKSYDQIVMPVITPSDNALRTQRWKNACMLLQPSSSTALLPRAYLQQPLFSGTEHWHYRTQMILEPSRNSDSRIILGGERDALGLPRVSLHWDIRSDDFRSGVAVYERLIQEISTSGLGRGQLVELDPEQLRRNGNPVAHHMGSAMMSANAENGVVDRNLKVFGSDNLYVASSAVFPSFGYSNPTMTIVALAHRLAHQLG